MFQEQNVQKRNLGVLSLEGSPEPLLATEFNERDGEISPDGRWLAYQSDASGQNENYVRPFPTVEDGQWLISSGGGSRPLWAPNDRELFYVAPALLRVPAVRHSARDPMRDDRLLGTRRGHCEPASPGKDRELGPARCKETGGIAPDGVRKDVAGGADRRKKQQLGK